MKRRASARDHHHQHYLTARRQRNVAKSKRMAKPNATVAFHSLRSNDAVAEESEDDTTVTVAVGADVSLVTVTGPLFLGKQLAFGRTKTVAGPEKWRLLS